MSKNTASLALLMGVAILSSLSLPSCVGKKKFTREVSTRDSMLTQVNKRVIELNQEIARQNIKLAEKDGENKVLRELQDKQDRQINRLQNEIEKLTTQSSSQQELMDLSLKRKQEELEEKEQIIGGMQQTLDKQATAMEEMLDKIRAALQQYDQRELSLDIRGGRAYVGLAEKLLFKSGSAQLSREAMPILEKIAEVLVNHPELDIIVEGHTDNVPIRSREFKDNWDLTAIRATAVARMLTKEFSLNPSQVTAAGRGEYLPRASNETAEGRALNRRTEIILSPRVDAIYKLIREAGKKAPEEKPSGSNGLN